MRFGILFILLVVSGSYSDAESDDQRSRNVISRDDECAAKCGGANGNKETDTCLLTCNQTHNNITAGQIVSKISVRCLNRNGSAVDAHVRFIPLEERSVKYLVTCQQHLGSYYKTISIDFAHEQNEEFNTTFWGLPSGANFNVSVEPILSNISGDMVSTTFSTPSRLKYDGDDTICAPLKLEGLNARVTNQVVNISDVVVTWDRPYIIPDFFIVNVTSSDAQAEEFHLQNVSGTATKTVLHNLTISHEFNVSIRAWTWGEEGEEITKQFSKPLDLDAFVITALTFVLSLPFVYIIYAYFRHRSQMQKKKMTESLKKKTTEVQSYDILSENDAH